MSIRVRGTNIFVGTFYWCKDVASTTIGEKGENIVLYNKLILAKGVV